MFHNRLWRRTSGLLAGALVAAVGLTAAGSGASAAPAPTRVAELDQAAYAQLAGGGTAEFFVELAAQADLSGADQLATKAARGSHVYQRLTSAAQASQADLRATLTARGITHTPYWIANTILVEGDRALLAELAGRPDVARIVPHTEVDLITPVAQEPALAAGVLSEVQSNIAHIKANQAWSTYGTTGEGITVATIDSGVQFHHPSLVDSYRGTTVLPISGIRVFGHNHNWFDFTGTCNPVGVPCDTNGHGTHVTGTMVGNGGIGVAPGARWIAAKACGVTSCPVGALLAAGQWMLAPTDLNGNNPDPNRAPDIVNNSWGGGGGNPFYQHIVDAWVSAGIFPVFSAGNSGPGCKTTGSPGDYQNAYAVGAYRDATGQIAGFSSRGPAQTPSGTFTTKPNVAAPGVGVRSSVPGGGFAEFDGTSMAAPHVAGTVALIWSAGPQVRGNVALTRTILDGTARRVIVASCNSSGGLGAPAAINSSFGFGQLDALAAVQAVAETSPLHAGIGSFVVCLPGQLRCTFNAGTSTGPIMSYSWDFGTGNTGFGLSGRPISHVFPAPGVYQVTLTVRSINGGVDTDTRLVTVS